MCGIVGMFTKNTFGFSYESMNAFEQMLFADTLRGTHGTGMFYNNKKNRISNLKGCMDGPTFLKDSKVIKSISDIYKEASFVVGHNRHATKGALNHDNTHPFKEGHITLVHNGTLRTHKGLKDVEVDSHAICHSINEIGHMDTLKKLEGAFTLVWANTSTGTVHFVRNHERPLYIAETASGWYIASEGKMLDWILSRNKINHYNIKMVPTKELYTFDLKTGTLTSEGVQFHEAPVTSYDFYQKRWDKEHPAKQLPAPTQATDLYSIKNGDVITFSPIDITKVGKAPKDNWLLTGLLESPAGSNDVDIEVKYMDPYRDYMDRLMKNTVLVGTVYQIHMRKGGDKSYYVRDIKIPHKASSFDYGQPIGY